MHGSLAKAANAIATIRQTNPKADLCCWIGTIFDEREHFVRHDKMWLLRLTRQNNKPVLLQTSACLEGGDSNSPRLSFYLRDNYKLDGPDGSRRNVHIPNASKLNGQILDIRKQLQEGQRADMFNPLEGADKYLLRVLGELDIARFGTFALPELYIMANTSGYGIQRRPDAGLDGPMEEVMANPKAHGLAEDMEGKYGFPLSRFCGKGVVAVRPRDFLRWWVQSDDLDMPWLYIEHGGEG